MFMTIIIVFLTIQGIALLLMLSSCAIAARADRRAERPYVAEGFVESGYVPVKASRPSSAPQTKLTLANQQ